VISAHRDTHFAFLRELVRGDLVTLDTREGARHYRVSATQIIDVRYNTLPASDTVDGLLLVTCYPFDALVPGGPLRYVVSAVAEDEAERPLMAIAGATG
jgi:sortase A